MEAADLSRKRVILVISGVMLGVLMSALDMTIVGTSMPRIIKDLDGMRHYIWPFTAYMLFSTLAVPIFGKLSDIYGRKLIYLIGIFIFLVSSILCGMSRDMIQLIVYRSLQGVGGGIMISLSFTVVGELFPPRERGKYIGIVASMFGLANLLGPAVGGAITEGLGWRWVFYVNIPFALIAIIIVALSLPSAIEHTEKRSVDFPGITALIAAFGPLLLAFSLAGREYAWLSPQVIGLLGFSALMLIIFALIERTIREPIMPPFLFKNSVFNISIVLSFLSNAAMFGSIIFIPLFIQGVQGANALKSGLITTPMMVTFVLFNILGGQIISRTGKYKILTVAGFMTGLAGMIMLMSLNAGTPEWMIIIYIVTLAAGLGLNNSIFNITAQNAFPMRHLGVTTASVQFFRNIGGTVGSAVYGSIMLSSLAGKLGQIFWGKTPADFIARLNDPKLLSNPAAMADMREKLPADLLPFFDSVLNQVKGILVISIHQVFIAGTVVLLAAIVTSFFMKEKPLSSHFEEKIKENPVETCDNC